MACETPLYPPASFPSRNIFSHPQNLNLNFLAEAEVGIAPKAETCLVFPRSYFDFCAVAICIFCQWHSFLFSCSTAREREGSFYIFWEAFQTSTPTCDSFRVEITTVRRPSVIGRNDRTTDRVTEGYIWQTVGRHLAVGINEGSLSPFALDEGQPCAKNNPLLQCLDQTPSSVRQKFEQDS